MDEIPITDTSEVIILPTIDPVQHDSSRINKYHDFECCEWTRGIDNLLFRYLQDREEVISLMLNDPDQLIRTIWKQNGPLAIDNECRCRMGVGEKRSPFACAQCKNLRRLIDFRIGGIEKPFKLECGESAGKNLIITSYTTAAPFLAWDDDAARRAKVYVQQYHDLTTCGTPNISGMKCITGDSFTIRTLILWIIHKMFTDKNLPHCPLMHTAFICRGIGYSLYDMPSIGTITELHKMASCHNLDVTTRSMSLKNGVARTIIIQLLVILLELSQINFSHGTPSVHGLVFTKDPVSYVYDEVQVIGPITLQITDLWNSSATFNKVHYFPKNLRSSVFIERNLFAPEISTRAVSMAHCSDSATCPDSTTYAVCKPKSISLYRLTNSTLDIYAAMRHIGFPLFVGSFDFYCFMVSLMCDKSFFDAVVHDDRLYRLWSMMWLHEDLSNIEQLIKETHANGEIPAGNRAASNTVINIIRGAWLRCDVIKFIWNLVKLGW